MTPDQINDIIIQLRRAAEILEDKNEKVSDKIQTLKTIGSISTHRGEQWHEQVFNDTLKEFGL